MNQHVVGSLVHLFKVTRNHLLDLLAVFEDFRFPTIRLPFDSSHHRMVPLNSQDLVYHLVELLHLAVTQQLAKVLDIFSFLERTSNREFLLFLFCVVAIVVPNRYVSPTLLQFLCLDSELISYCLFRDIFISRLSDRVVRL
jgi:hypothetical protein